MKKLTELKGIGPKTESLFAKLGITSQEDLLRYYPVHYDAFEEPVKIAELIPGAKMAVAAHVESRPVLRTVRNLTILSCEATDETGKIRITWFNAPFLAKQLIPGEIYVFRGNVSERKGRVVLDHPEFTSPAAYAEKVSTLVPVYGLTKGLNSRAVGRAVGQVLENPACSEEFLPESLLRLHGLIGEEEALRGIHFPENADALEAARRRLVFDEFLLFVLLIRLLRRETEEEKTAFPMEKTWAAEELLHRLPFRLTKAQLRVWKEIEADLAGAHPMARLVQGDVGSGKTVIAFLSMLMAAENGWQSALMAPTEVLAKQHYEKLCALVKEQHLEQVRPVLLLGSTKAADRRRILAEIADGSANAVIGTHALFQESVAYRDLALVITDEQHRFGVHQREALARKGSPPHCLVMSATPIPRTLGVIYYGDLDISVIDELPAKRLPIRNCVVDESFLPQALRFVRKQLGEGRQVYLICPMIEESEGLDAANVTDEYKRIRKEFPEVPCAMLHGRMKAEAKERVMADFSAGKTKILVSTTVVEVGVDVPNATLMWIRSAERFGLAALHQLRGRVGRGEHQSYCIFMAGQKNPAALKRLEILNHSSDGFEIAEKDLSLRGPGDLTGIRQSGDARFRLADVTKDGEILRLAGETAAAVLHDDPCFADPQYVLLGRKVRTLLEDKDTSLAL